MDNSCQLKKIFFGTAGGRVLLTRITRAFGSTKINSGIFSSQVGFMLPIGQTRQGAYYASFALSFGRAQKRVAQQRIDSKIDLGRIVDIRKKVFSDVKVCPFFFFLSNFLSP